MISVRKINTRRLLVETILRKHASDPWSTATTEVPPQPSWFPVLLKGRESHQNRPAWNASSRVFFGLTA